MKIKKFNESASEEEIDKLPDIIDIEMHKNHYKLLIAMLEELQEDREGSAGDRKPHEWEEELLTDEEIKEMSDLSELPESDLESCDYVAYLIHKIKEKVRNYNL